MGGRVSVPHRLWHLVIKKALRACTNTPLFHTVFDTSCQKVPDWKWMWHCTWVVGDCNQWQGGGDPLPQWGEAGTIVGGCCMLGCWPTIHVIYWRESNGTHQDMSHGQFISTAIHRMPIEGSQGGLMGSGEGGDFFLSLGETVFAFML